MISNQEKFDRASTILKDMFEYITDNGFQIVVADHLGEIGSYYAKSYQFDNANDMWSMFEPELKNMLNSDCGAKSSWEYSVFPIKNVNTIKLPKIYSYTPNYLYEIFGEPDGNVVGRKYCKFVQRFLEKFRKNYSGDEFAESICNTDEMQQYGYDVIEKNKRVPNIMFATIWNQLFESVKAYVNDWLSEEVLLGCVDSIKRAIPLLNVSYDVYAETTFGSEQFFDKVKQFVKNFEESVLLKYVKLNSRSIRMCSYSVLTYSIRKEVTSIVKNCKWPSDSNRHYTNIFTDYLSENQNENGIFPYDSSEHMVGVKWSFESLDKKTKRLAEKFIFDYIKNATKETKGIRAGFAQTKEYHSVNRYGSPVSNANINGVEVCNFLNADKAETFDTFVMNIPLRYDAIGTSRDAIDNFIPMMG